MAGPRSCLLTGRTCLSTAADDWCQGGQESLCRAVPAAGQCQEGSHSLKNLWWLSAASPGLWACPGWRYHALPEQPGEFLSFCQNKSSVPLCLLIQNLKEVQAWVTIYSTFQTKLHPSFSRFHEQGETTSYDRSKPVNSKILFP